MWGDLPDGVIVQGSGHPFGWSSKWSGHLGGVVIQVEWSSRWSGHPGGVVIQVEWSSRWSGHPVGVVIYVG